MEQNHFVAELENNFFNTLFSIAWKTFKNITLSYLVYMGISLLLLGGIFTSILGVDSLQIFSPEMQQNPELIQEFFKTQSTDLFNSSFIGGVLIMGLISLLVVSWMQYFSYIATSAYIKNDSQNFKDILYQSLNSGIFRMLGAFLLLYLIMIVMFIVAMSTIAISGFIAFLLVIGVSIFLYRFILIIPAYVLGRHSMSDSFALSFQHITWFKALKYFGTTVLAILVLFLFGIILGLFGLILNMIPFVGVAIHYIIQILMGGFFTALGAALFVGLYFRATGELKDIEDNDNDDLIINSLGEE